MATIGGFPKIRGTIVGVPIIRTIIYWGLYWGPPILGNYHMLKLRQELSPFTAAALPTVDGVGFGV